MSEPTPQRALILFTGVLVIITAGIVLVWLSLIALHFLRSKLIPAAPYSPVFLSSTQTGPLYTIDLNHASSSPVLFRPQGTGTSTIIDAVTEASTTYFLMFDRATLSSNLYEINLKTPGVGVQQLTTSTTTKWHLGYDAPSHTLVYDAATVSKKTGVANGNTITIFNTTVGTEKGIGSGTNPTFLPGGIMVVAASNGKIIIINDVSGVQTSLLSATSPLFAISPDGKTLVTYNAPSKTLDSYSLQNVTSASYQQAQPAPFYPQAMMYEGDRLLIAGQMQTDPPILQLQFVGEKAPVASFEAKSLNLFSNFIASLHL